MTTQLTAHSTAVRRKGGGTDIGIGAVNVKVSKVTVPMTGGAATVTATGARLAKKYILGISGRVRSLVSGASLTSLNIGDGSDADRYGATIALVAGTAFDYSNATADPREWLAAAGDLVFTAVGGVAISAGSIDVEVHYLDIDAPGAVA